MKILHVNTSDYGGAAKACLRLHEGLMKNGVDSNVLVLQQYSYQQKNIFNFQKYHKTHFFKKIKRSLRYRLDTHSKKRLLKNKPNTYEAFSFPDTIYDIVDLPLVQEANIIHLHWIAGFLDYASFFRNIKKPVIWTLHDRNPILGGFHYEVDLQRNQPDFQELNQQIAQKKIKILTQAHNLQIVSPSDWMYQQAVTSDQFQRFRHYLIPNGLDTEIFKPIHRASAREILNLPSDKKIILFVSEFIHNRNKGLEYLKEALKKLNNPDIALCVLGNGKLVCEDLEIYNLDFISDDRLLPIVYNAADIFVSPTLEDNLPNTVMEAMACALPTVVFEVGGIPDMVKHRENGLLVPPKEVNALSQAIQDLLENSSLSQKLGNKARQTIQEKFVIATQTKKYTKIYQESLSPH